MAKPKTQVALDTENDKATILYLLRSPQGRRWIWLELSKAHVFNSTFNQSYGVMCFSEGERNIGLQLLNRIMRYSPQAFGVMMAENANLKPENKVENDERSEPEPDAE